MVVVCAFWLMAVGFVLIVVEIWQRIVLTRRVDSLELRCQVLELAATIYSRENKRLAPEQREHGTGSVG
ncbi:MAG TPA: hypothetical protein VNH21_12400 [Steroidobacteraceae bacterium]|nr:hypothetical protein [Steroidobacteraceae bacterium]